jgi:hypothetical protein
MVDAGLASFLTTARLAATGLFALWALLSLRIRWPGWILLGTLGWCVYLWGISTLPLGRVYGLGASNDRLNNMAICTPVAAGSPFYETHQVGQLNWEPFWSGFAAAVSGWDADRLLRIYPYLPLLVVSAFGLSLYFGLRPAGDSDPEAWTGWERAFATFFALMLSTSPLDYEGTYRANWSVNFLLKPNHALALVLLPPLLALLVRIRTCRGRVGAGLLLHLIGWAFVLHWVYICTGMLVYLGLTRVQRRPSFRKALADMATALAVNGVLVSPYLFMLLRGYPFMERFPAYALRSVGSHILEVTLDQGVIFFLALWGGRVLYRRADALSRLWLSLALGSLALWLGYIGLSLAHFAREPDELYYFLRILSAILAGTGAWDLARSLGSLWRIDAAKLPAGILLLCLPLALPCWWDPVTMDSYFSRSLPPLPEPLGRTMSFIREKTDPGGVFVAGRDFSRYVAALGGRRLLRDKTLHEPPDPYERYQLEKRLLVEGDLEAGRTLLERYGVRYVLFTPELEIDHPGLTWSTLVQQPHWTLLWETGGPEGEFFGVLRLELDPRTSPGGRE